MDHGIICVGPDLAILEVLSGSGEYLALQLGDYIKHESSYYHAVKIEKFYPLSRSRNIFIVYFSKVDLRTLNHFNEAIIDELERLTQ